MFWKTQSIPNKVKETPTPNKHMKEAGVYQHISQNHYNHFLLTHACNSRPNPSTVFVQVFAVNGILPTSAMPQSHSHSGHTPTSTWGAAWKIALWNLESFIKFFACEKTLASSSASAVMIPTQNSTIRARTGNTIFVLCEKGYSVFFNEEGVWQQGHTYRKKNSARTCLVAFLAFTTLLPGQSNSAWQNCSGTFIQSSLTAKSHK